MLCCDQKIRENIDYMIRPFASLKQKPHNSVKRMRSNALSCVNVIIPVLFCCVYFTLAHESTKKSISMRIRISGRLLREHAQA